MPRQLDQLPPDPTSLARRLAALEREVRELRAARRLSSATAELIRTAASGPRVEINGTTQAVDLYGDDGTTLLAELATNTSGTPGGGLWTRGLQDPYNMSAFLGGGELTFQPVQSGLVDTAAAVSYDTDSTQFADLILTSGAIGASDMRARIILETVTAGQPAWVYVTGDQSAPCNLDVNGVLTAANLAWGQVSITPSAANTPTSVNVTGLNLQGTTFLGWAVATTAVPGSGVTGSSATNVTSTGLTVWTTRTTTAQTFVNWLVIGI
ncbi:hypothetical protein ACFZAR_43165 [Streptomyces sp. NPDC008222]|uniref:hypothetical protein n=1 Tax=Streptomyces sp. NPDC008222 TaxID=3364820 RepID=UPI0036ECB3F7